MSKLGEVIQHTKSRIFENFRVLGKVSNGTPCLLRYIHRRRENFVITCTGKSFNTYAGQQLKLLSTSEPVPEEINAMATDTFHVYTATSQGIYVWRRGAELQRKLELSPNKITQILPFGQDLIVLESTGQIHIYGIKGEGLLKSIPFNLRIFHPKVIMHPSTYLNKVLIGSEQGTMEIWNIFTMSLIYRFEGWSASIMNIIQAPALDVVAVVLSDKRVILHNLKLDETIMELNCLHQPTSLAFRTDGQPILLVGGDAGSITCWDLENQEILFFQETAHLASVSGLQFFPQEPLFVSSSVDNSVRVWIFDMPDGSFRLLNSREGHFKACNKIRFHGPENNSILSSSLDSSFRVFHLFNENCSRALKKYGVTYKELKIEKDFTLPDSKFLPPIVDFTSECAVASSTHAEIAACHQDTLGITLWSFSNSSMTPTLLIHPKYKNLPMAKLSATCLSLTSCGQFVIAGFSNGTIERFNIHSGIHRKSYNPAHSADVRGIAVDGISSFIVSGSGDSTIKVWSFMTSELVKTFELTAGVSFMFKSPKTDLVGVALDDFSLLVFDISSQAVLRKFTQMTDAIIAATFSPNSKWVTASSGDCLVRTWCLPTAKMIDVFRVEAIASSMDYSSNNLYLAMALHNELGIFLWRNVTMFTHVSLLPLPDNFEPGIIEGSNQEDLLESEEEEYQSPEQIQMDMITLSNLPQSRWANLFNIDMIKKRNKPKAAPKTYLPPFFLSAIANNSRDHEGKDAPIEPPESKIMNLPVKNYLTKELSREFKDLAYYEILMKTMEEFGPSMTEMEMRLLGPDDGGSFQLLKEFIRFICEIVKTNKFFEASQAFLALFLRMHGRKISEDEELMRELDVLLEEVEKRDNTLVDLGNTIMSYAGFLKSNLY